MDETNLDAKVTAGLKVHETEASWKLLVAGR